MWTITPYPPSDQVKQFIEFYWIGRVIPGNSLPLVNLPPTGSASILLVFGNNPLKLRNFNGELRTIPEATLMGQYYNYLETHIPGDFAVLGILLKPNAFHKMRGLNMQELTHGIHNAEDVLDKSIGGLVNDLKGDQSDFLRIAMVDSYLIRLFKSVSKDNTLTESALALLYHKDGNIKIDDLASYFHCSRRLLEKKFKEQIGVSPKYYARVIQFNNVLVTVKQQNFKSWADLALKHGYYDQAHMIKTFVEFTGSSPQGYTFEDNDITKFYL